jgi:hypothetical protein
MIRVDASAARRAAGMLAVAGFVLAATPACAQTVYRGQSQWGSRAAYDNGYREGRDQGERDARQRRNFSLERSNEYRRADRGYDRRDGNIEWYRREFRRGYEIGYRDGYGRAGYGGRGNYDPYNDRRGRAGGYGYPSGGYGYPSGGYYGAAFQYGLNDGYEKGLEDARDGDRYDPVRHRWYRDGDRHYNSRYGAREVYKNEYRQGFREGYDRAFREGGRYGSSRRGRWWPF